MGNTVYFSFLWLVIIALVIGTIVVIGALSWYDRLIDVHPQYQRYRVILLRTRGLLWAFTLLMTFGGVAAWYGDQMLHNQEISAQRAALLPVFDKTKVWQAPDSLLANTDPHARLIAYGRDIIARTQDYFGEYGLVRPGSTNGMNCQNCHLDAGRKPFGNNYFAVQSTYPQLRARSGALETIPKRVNDCFQRSLNGQPLDTTSHEMQAVLAYLRWLGTGVPKGEKPQGAGLVEVPLLDRPADPARGQKIYTAKCASCHGAHGEGLAMPGSPRYYPPLWGDKSYNAGAGLFRLSRLAGYVKANMPFGASYQNPQLSDEEAWDVSGFINSQPRPEHPFLHTDWPKIEKKPFDHPFGPYADPFPEIQHKYGPFGPIIAFYKTLLKKN